MNKEKTCQGKNSDSAKKFGRISLIAIRVGPVLYTRKNALPRRGIRGTVSSGRGVEESGRRRDAPSFRCGGSPHVDRGLDRKMIGGDARHLRAVDIDRLKRLP